MMELSSICRSRLSLALSFVFLLLVVPAVSMEISDSDLSNELQNSRWTQEVITNPFIGGQDPVWWETYRAQFGKRAKKCVDVPSVPVNGTACPSKKIGEYNCFFGGQVCSSDGSQHPKVKCDCSSNGRWNCADYDPCGVTVHPPFSVCPDKHPLDFPFKLTCQSDFLVCNYGRVSCCGESFPTSSCECIQGEFVCFNHDTCRFRDCNAQQNCPSIEPNAGDVCNQPNRGTCAYGERPCCGNKWQSRVHHCFDNKWDVVTDVLYGPCDCGAPQTPAPVPVPTDGTTITPPPTNAPSLDPFPTMPDTCQCQSDLDCQKPKCQINPFTNFGVCTSVPSPAPSSVPSTSFPSLDPSISPSTSFPSLIPSRLPSVNPSSFPSSEPSLSPSNVPSQVPSGMPSNQPSLLPSAGPSRVPSTNPSGVPSGAPSTCTCKPPKKNVPSDCEINLLIDMMETNVKAEHALLPRWLRLAFHDAGTFDKNTGVGGANGCLLNHPPMRLESENQFLEDPINALLGIKRQWESHPAVCLNVSSADMIQFAGLFSTVRQSVTNTTVGPGLTIGKINVLKFFEWGRPDEPKCEAKWTASLPGFQTGTAGRALRCLAAGKEIKEKMMGKNGFTARESAALLGAHSIGLIRFSFGELFRGPWVKDGADDATTAGPVFNNAYHDFLQNDIPTTTADEFEDDMAPFKADFGPFNWFSTKSPGVHGDGTPRLNHLDTDVTLAFPSQNETTHPNFHQFTVEFANSNLKFLEAFFPALDKMSKLGVTVPLGRVGICDACAPAIITQKQLIDTLLNLGDAKAKGDAVQNQRQQKRIDEIQLLTTPNVTETPSVQPSFSSVPSASPSSPTTMAPSILRAPTNVPSHSIIPSGSPSAPSMSSFPSGFPSAPSASQVPSSRPSNDEVTEKQVEDAKQFFDKKPGDDKVVDLVTGDDSEE